MLKLNLIVAYRSLLRNKFYASINIFGLALGLATCLFISIYVLDEMSYDKHWANSERIYRIAGDLKFNDNEFKMAVSPAPMAAAFRNAFPELEAIGRLQDAGDDLVKIGENFYEQKDIAFADPEILDIFKLSFIDGSEQGLLENATDAMLSKETSIKLFGSLNSVGKTFELNNSTFEVKAIYDDIASNSHFHFKMMLSTEYVGSAKSQIWLSNNFSTYLLFDENNQWDTFEEKIPSVTYKHFSPQLQQAAGVDIDTFLKTGGRLNYYIQPVTDIHLKSNLQYEIESNGDLQFVYIFIAAGLFVLIIAIINFMNISTARSSLRAKEVGLRKVMGSKRKLLITQFITESMLNTCLAMIVALMLLFLFLPFFNEITSKDISNPLFGPMQLWDETLLALLAVGFISGLYPAFYLSGFIPIKVLKGNIALGLKSGGLRNALVIVQFGASVVLIFGAIVIYSQLNYTMKKHLGFDKDNAIVISETQYLGEKVDEFKQELLSSTSITNATLSNYLPVKGNRSDSPLMPEGMTDMDGAVSFQIWAIDDDYIPTLKMTLAQGRNFDENLSSDSSSIIINQSAVQSLGFQDPIGKKIKSMPGFDIHGRSLFTIIGVVEDFHIDNFQNQIGAVALMRGRSRSALTIRFETENVGDVLSVIESKWDEFSPNIPLKYTFMDQQFEDQYASEQRLGSLFNIFAALAILIACLGLFGLAAFTTDQRKKEIGIRKVLGASVKNLMVLQLSGYTKMLLIAIVISMPIAYYVTGLWLERFVYRTSFDVSMFVLPAAVVLGLAWLTVSVISYTASRRNPVDNLKYE